MTTEEEGGVNLYMRVNDAVTYEIAHGKQSIRLIGMTSDGSKVVFASRDHVTPDDTDAPFSNDIYVWEEQTNEITRVSQGNGAGNSDSCEPPEEPGFIFCSAVPAENRTARQRRPDRLRKRRRLLLLAGAARPEQPGCPQREEPLRLPARRRQIRRHPGRKHLDQPDPDLARRQSRRLPHGRASDQLRQRGLARDVHLQPEYRRDQVRLLPAFRRTADRPAAARGEPQGAIRSPSRATGAEQGRDGQPERPLHGRRRQDGLRHLRRARRKRHRRPASTSTSSSAAGPS